MLNDLEDIAGLDDNLAEKRRGSWAICPEVAGANGQGETIDEAKSSLRQAIELILEDRKG